jgi:hypothetical protein
MVIGVTGGDGAAIGRRSARAILFDDAGRLLLIKRTKPGQAPYWTTPGGGIEGPTCRWSRHFFVARLTGLDEAARSGPEFSDPSRGGYELDRIDLRGEALATIDFRPAALKEFILANREALQAEAASS